MTLLILLQLMSGVTSAQDTTVWGTRAVDLTGDGVAEILLLVDSDADSSNGSITFVVESKGIILYQTEISPSLADRAEFVEWFFADEKFRPFDEFLEELAAWGTRFVHDIPAVIGREYRRQVISDSLVAAGRTRAHAEQASRLTALSPGDAEVAGQIWADIRAAAPPVFTFSPGGDVITALAWSPRQGRFFNLVECC